MELPDGVKLLDKGKLSSLVDRAPGIQSSPHDASEIWGVECDQRCFSAFLLNATMALLCGVFAVCLVYYMWQNRAPDFWVSCFALLGIAGALRLLYSVAVTLTWRVWLTFVPGKILWFRKSCWRKETKVMDIAAIEAVFHVCPNGGGPKERALSVRLAGNERVELLYDCDRAGLCAWMAQRILERTAPRAVQFVDQPVDE